MSCTIYFGEDPSNASCNVRKTLHIDSRLLCLFDNVQHVFQQILPHLCLKIGTKAAVNLDKKHVFSSCPSDLLLEPSTLVSQMLLCYFITETVACSSVNGDFDKGSFKLLESVVTHLIVYVASSKLNYLVRRGMQMR